MHHKIHNLTYKVFLDKLQEMSIKSNHTHITDH